MNRQHSRFSARVQTNAAWQPEETLELRDAIERCAVSSGPEFVRQTAPAMESHYLEMLRQVLNKSKLPLTVEELQRKLQSIRTFDQLSDDELFQKRRGRRFLRRWRDRIKDLWNYTPRSELGGKRPSEYLVELVERGADIQELKDCPVHVPSDFFF